MKVRGHAEIKYPWYMQRKWNAIFAGSYMAGAIAGVVFSQQLVQHLLALSWAALSGWYFMMAVSGHRNWRPPIVVNLAVGMYPTEDDSKQTHESDSVRIH